MKSYSLRRDILITTKYTKNTKTPHIFTSKLSDPYPNEAHLFHLESALIRFMALRISGAFMKSSQSKPVR